MQHSCSHYNAICNQRFKNRIELRTQTQPLVAKHIGETIRAQNDPSRTRRTDEVPFIVACSHFTRKNTRFRAPASSPKHSPCNTHAAIPMRSALPSSPLPFVTTSLRHHFPSSPLPFVTTSLRHHFHSSPPCVIASSLHQGQFHRFYRRHQGQSLCDVLLCNVKSHTTLHQGQFFSDVLLCSVKSHTTLHQSQFFSDVLFM